MMKTVFLENCITVSVFFYCIVVSIMAVKKECERDAECNLNWPNSVCRRSRCACQPDSIRRASSESSLGWVCLSLFDVVTNQLGPPLTCPLPDGAGFRMILKDSNEKIVFCNFHTNYSKGCPATHECIKSIGTFSDQWNGVCCPKRELACQTMPEQDPNGYLERWFYNGSRCEKFLWNPEATITPNTFLTVKHCASYCGGGQRNSNNRNITAFNKINAVKNEDAVVLNIQI